MQVPASDSSQHLHTGGNFQKLKLMNCPTKNIKHSAARGKYIRLQSQKFLQFIVDNFFLQEQDLLLRIASEIPEAIHAIDDGTKDASALCTVTHPSHSQVFMVPQAGLRGGLFALCWKVP